MRETSQAKRPGEEPAIYVRSVRLSSGAVPEFYRGADPDLLLGREFEATPSEKFRVDSSLNPNEGL
jgi:hypothetical protein